MSRPQHDALDQYIKDANQYLASVGAFELGPSLFYSQGSRSKQSSDFLKTKLNAKDNISCFFGTRTDTATQQQEIGYWIETTGSDRQKSYQFVSIDSNEELKQEYTKNLRFQLYNNLYDTAYPLSPGERDQSKRITLTNSAGQSNEYLLSFTMLYSANPDWTKKEGVPPITIGTSPEADALFYQVESLMLKNLDPALTTSSTPFPRMPQLAAVVPPPARATATPADAAVTQLVTELKTKQKTTYDEIFMSSDSKKTGNLRVDAHFDWWIFPSSSRKNPHLSVSKDDAKGQAVYAALAQDADFCKRYAHCVKIYLDACGWNYDENHPKQGATLFKNYPERFAKLRESLLGLTANNTIILAGLDQVTQNLLFRNVYEFEQASGQVEKRVSKYHKQFSDQLTAVNTTLMQEGLPSSTASEADKAKATQAAAAKKAAEEAEAARKATEAQQQAEAARKAAEIKAAEVARQQAEEAAKKSSEKKAAETELMQFLTSHTTAANNPLQTKFLTDSISAIVQKTKDDSKIKKLDGTTILTVAQPFSLSKKNILNATKPAAAAASHDAKLAAGPKQKEKSREEIKAEAIANVANFKAQAAAVEKRQEGSDASQERITITADMMSFFSEKKYNANIKRDVMSTYITIAKTEVGAPAQQELLPPPGLQGATFAGLKLMDIPAAHGQPGKQMFPKGTNIRGMNFNNCDLSGVSFKDISQEDFDTITFARCQLPHPDFLPDDCKLKISALATGHSTGNYRMSDVDRSTLEAPGADPRQHFENPHSLINTDNKKGIGRALEKLRPPSPDPKDPAAERLAQQRSSLLEN